MAHRFKGNVEIPGQLKFNNTTGEPETPSSGGVLYVSGTAVNFKDTGGTVTDLTSGGGSVTHKHTQSTPASTWTVNHNKNNSDYQITVFDTSGEVFIPFRISTTNSNTVTIQHLVARDGKAIFVFI